MVVESKIPDPVADRLFGQLDLVASASEAHEGARQALKHCKDYLDDMQKELNQQLAAARAGQRPLFDGDHD